MNCMDPMGRSALCTAVDNENMDMLNMLLEMGVQVKVRSLALRVNIK